MPIKGKVIELSSSSSSSSIEAEMLVNSLNRLKNNTDNINFKDIAKRISSASKSSGPTEDRISYVKNITKKTDVLPATIEWDSNDATDTYVKKANSKYVDLNDWLADFDAKMMYVKSGTTGHTFKGISTEDKNISSSDSKPLFAIKVSAYPKDKDYGRFSDLERPENAELSMIALLSKFVTNKQTPHLVLPIYNFRTHIKYFTNNEAESFAKKISERKSDDSYLKFINKYKEGEFEDFVSILISEWADGGDLLDYVRKNYEKISVLEWKVIFFQIIFTLATIQNKYPCFRHNDLKANNVLVFRADSNKSDKIKHFRYNYTKTQKDKNIKLRFKVPDLGLRLAIWDFDFACIKGIVENKKVNARWTKKLNISSDQNRYYDVHYFVNTLMSKRFFKNFYDGVPDEVIEFCHRIVPPEYREGGKYAVKEKQRVNVKKELITPEQIIMQDQFFAEFRQFIY